MNKSLGAASLLTVFASLCLITFSLLALAIAQSDERISIASAQAVENYYTADCRAQEVLLELRKGHQPKGVLQEGNIYSYEIPISDNLNLCVEVSVRGSDYEIITWQVRGE